MDGRRFFIMGVILLLASELMAQPVFKMTRYAKEQGLSHNTITNLTMDDRGFLWIATVDGLNRFDGLEMKVYRPDETDSTAISDGFIHGIHQHEDGKLWVSTRDGGLNFFDPVTERFESLNYKKRDRNNFPDRQISLLYKDSSFRYWLSFFGHSMGLLDPESNIYYPANIIDSKTGVRKTSINAVIEFTDGSMLVSSFSGLFYLSAEEITKYVADPSSGEEVIAVSIPYSKEVAFQNMSNLKIDSNGDLWVNLVTSGLQKMERERVPKFLTQSIRSGIKGNSSGGLVIERDGYLISGYLDNKLLYVDLETGEQSFKVLDTGVSLDGATYLYKDMNEDLWVYTWGAGFYKLEEQKGVELINNTVQPGVFESDFMLGFEEGEEGIWIASAAEVLFFDQNTEEIQSLNERLMNDKVAGTWAIEKDNLGLWLVTIEQGLVFIPNSELDLKERFRAKRFTAQNSFIKSKNLHNVLRDSRGWLWLGYEGDGIQIVKDPASWVQGNVSEVLELLPLDDGENVSLSSGSIREFFEDNDRNIWAATTDNGFEKITIVDQRVVEARSMSFLSSDINSIPHNDARSVYQQNDSTYWFATYGGGIAKWNTPSNKFTRYSTRNGLPNNSTYSIIPELDNRYLWVSTNSGLARLDTRTETFHVLTEDDGLQNNEFNTGAYYRLSDGRLIFGGINGINIIDPDKLTTNQKAPPVYITSIDLFDEAIQSDTAATEIRNLELSYKENFLSFTFAALDFENPKENQFAYKMEGVDDDWVRSGNRNYAGYPNLQPGSYTFKVKASNNDGVWNEAGKSISISISPPWWETAWFRIISGIILLTGVILGVRYVSQRRLREQIRKMEVENKLRNERERISRDLHDHVGSQLANIMSGLSLADKYNQVDNREKSSSLMNSLRGDAEVTIKQLRETIWALNQNSLTLVEFKDHLQGYFGNQTAFKESLDINYQVEEEKETALSSTQALNLFRIIQEASQNTLKYADAKTLNIVMKRNNGSLCISIKDDGVFKGESSTFNGGYGFGNMKKRAKELKGEIEVSTESGTEIIIKIPL
jgi:signal transduction histidine kinase/ligand-binding sensor domain-containing protein